MNASQISAMVRAKKKKMTDDPDVVSLSGIPEDANDIDLNKRLEATDAMNENRPAGHKENEDDGHMSADERSAKISKMQKIKMMISKMNLEC